MKRKPEFKKGEQVRVKGTDIISHKIVSYKIVDGLFKYTVSHPVLCNTTFWEHNLEAV